MSTTDFEKYTLPALQYDDVAAEYDQITRELDGAASGPDAIAAVEKWDALRRRLFDWISLVNIRFNQDTRNAEYIMSREYCDELEPKLTNLAVSMKRRLMDSPHRAAIEDRFGRHVFDLWKCDIAAFDPAIEDDLVEQSKLYAEFKALLASAKFEFQGQSLTLSEIMKFNEHADRTVRHDAARLRWDWFGGNQEQLDTIFDKLVRVRQTMAEKLGFENFIGAGYQRMQRIDYGQADVERFREQVRKLVVPVAIELRRQQADALGVDPLMAWDEAIYDPAGNPKPRGDHDWLIEQGSRMFAELGGGMDELYEQMRARNAMDLKSREGKAGGGFCDVLPDFGLPFIYANFDGTMYDMLVFTHEMGHAFQTYVSLKLPLADYIIGTMESCEVHSTGLEFLSWPQMRLFFGDDAQRARRTHLKQKLVILPYIVAVDHFQHLVYANPHCSREDRAAMWQEMERTYLPTLKWGDLAHPASGRRWHAQQHIFGVPFYYIDYALAQTCAMQLWARAAEDRDGAMDAYVRLCHRGGEAPFGELVKSAGLGSPFEDGCLERAVQHARRELEAAT
ncbi:MAG: M3 family oligoendopeptidase [Planctomycetes bacterium]|nr:M3 family oligoendopeptidase [Planctomycetota bacterium]